MQEPPGIIHDLTEPLFDPFRNKVKHQPQGHGARGTAGALIEVQSPATGSRTQDPLRFPGRTHPPTSDVYVYR